MEIYVTQFVLFLMLLARIASLMIVAPVFGSQSVPPVVKIALALFLSFVLYPLAAQKAPSMDLQLMSLVLVAMKEVVVGLLLGFATGLIFEGVRVAGELMGFDLGFSMATVFDPETSQNNPILSEFMVMLMTLVFLLVNGHHFVLQGLQVSYEVVPVGGFTMNGLLSQKLIALTAGIFAVGIQLAAPVMVSSFLVNIAMGVLARVSPQINVFIVSLPVKIFVGFVVLMTAGPVMIYVFKKMLTGFESNILELVRVM